MFDLAGNHYPSRVLLEHIDIRHLKSQPQHKHAQQSISESMQITLSETIVALTILAVRCGKGFRFTLRNLWSKKANQFVSIFSATDSVL